MADGLSLSLSLPFQQPEGHKHNGNGLVESKGAVDKS